MTGYQPRRAARHESLTIRGLDHHVSRWGPAGAEPVVLMHGWADTADTFQFMVDELRGDWPLAAFDWRGFGRSGASPHGYWFPDYLADLDQLLDRLCPTGPACLIGHSMGGNIALWYAGVRPERVGRVVSLEGFGLPRTRPEQSPDRIAAWLNQLRDAPGFSEYKDHADLAQRLVARNPRLTHERALFIAESWAAPTRDGVRLRADPAHKQLNPYLYRREEAEACWQRIRAPALLVLGEQSEFRQRLGEDGSDVALRRQIPGLRIEIMAGVGHMLHHEQPDAVARLVEDFISESTCNSLNFPQAAGPPPGKR